jgi:TPP-dependent pyruvate/acetoin dehydrogenase alpha subunit
VVLSAEEAIENARKGEGPTLIECITYKMKGHGIYDKAEYRPKEEVEEWRRRDPIETFEAKLLKMKLAAQTDIDRIEKEVAILVEESVAFAKSSPVLPFEELGDFVYAR